MKKVVSLIALVVTLSPCSAQKNSSVEAFIKKLERSVVAERQNSVVRYLSEVETTPVIEGKENVHFIWYGKADTLKIEGELQKCWSTPAILSKIDCGEKDFFYISYKVPADALFEYRFIADGKRIVDLKNPRITQGFGFDDRNIFAMPDFIESPSLKTRYNIDKGTIRQWLFKTEDSIFTSQPIWIYTPYGYSNEKEYPVLYVYDGMPSLYTRPFLNVADNLIYDKKIEPIVIVFIGFEDRWNEYVQQSTEYAKLIAYKLVPFIEKNFKVSNASAKRGIIGASASGHGAIVTAFRHSDVFGNVASQGGGAGGYPGLNPLANAALDVYVTRKDKYPLRKIYSEVGNYDLEFPDQKIIFSDGVQQFHKRLKENSIDNVFSKVNSGHNATIWNQSLDKILILFYGK